jgi:hypothetical protein
MAKSKPNPAGVQGLLRSTAALLRAPHNLWSANKQAIKSTYERTIRHYYNAIKMYDDDVVVVAAAVAVAGALF